MEKIKTLLKVYKDKAPSVTIKEEMTTDSDLELNPKIKDKNFFEDDSVVDFLLDNKDN